MRVLVAIPVYNELGFVSHVVEKVRRYAEHVVVIDDGSTDGTTEVLDGLDAVGKIFHGKNLGYGQALISAFAHATGHAFDWLITMDCDEQHEPEFIPRFIATAAEDHADIISGSRYLGKEKSEGQPPPDRRRINQHITAVLNDTLGLSLTDAFCGFKAYRVSILDKLRIDVPGYAMPLQLWVQAARLGLRIVEIPVRLIYKDPTRHFGGDLDDPQLRLQHYLEVLNAELLKRDAGTRCHQTSRLGTVACR